MDSRKFTAGLGGFSGILQVLGEFVTILQTYAAAVVICVGWAESTGVLQAVGMTNTTGEFGAIRVDSMQIRIVRAQFLLGSCSVHAQFMPDS